jgi:uncharacterized protein
MSDFELPDRVNPYQLADKLSRLEGVIGAKRLKRLEEATAGIDESAQVSLGFDRDESGRRLISGHVTAIVNLQCQRCLQVYGSKLEGDFTLALVYNDEMAKALPTHLDALLLLPDALLDVADVVEEELLLSLPMHAMHPEGECRIETQFGTDEPTGSAGKAPNPFDVLKVLK